MALWNKDKAFRNDYEKRILASLDMRQLSRDGRMRNLEEPKPAEAQRRDLKSKPESKDVAETDEYEFESPEKEAPAKEPEIDPAKLKEMKREEEIAKAKQALERKKKLAEKAAAKAAIRAQKEAEKKLKVICLFVDSFSFSHSIVIHFPKPETAFNRTVRRKQRRNQALQPWPTLRTNRRMKLSRLQSQKRLTMMSKPRLQ